MNPKNIPPSDGNDLDYFISPRSFDDREFASSLVAVEDKVAREDVSVVQGKSCFEVQEQPRGQICTVAFDSSRSASCSNAEEDGGKGSENQQGKRADSTTEGGNGEGDASMSRYQTCLSNFKETVVATTSKKTA